MLPAPRLDDRGFQELVDEAKRLVMRRCPEWTDHNVSDPGVTLIETFASMTDAMLYRLNRVPGRLYVKFLDMIGLRMIPAAAARAPVTFWLATPPDAVYTVLAGTVVATPGSNAAPSLVFSTLETLELVPTTQEGLVTAPVASPEEDRTSTLALESPVAAFSAVPMPGDMLYVGLDRAAPSCAIRLDVVAQTQGIGVNPKAPPLCWQALCDVQDPESPADGWEGCDVTDDTTGGLNRSGSLVVHLPRQ